MEMPLRMGIVLMPQFTLGALAPFADMVGLLPSGSDEQPLCTAEIVADTLIPVRSANGTQIVPEGLLGEAARFDCVVLVGGAQAPEPGAASTGLHVWLRQAARAGCHLVGLCSAVFVLAEAGLLDGRRLSLNAAHWPAFVQRFPAFEPWQLITDRLHVQDGRRITCAGGTGALLETVLQILRRHLPAQGIRQALLGLQQAEPGPGALLAPAPRPELHPVPPALQRALVLIEQYAAQPLSADHLAERVGVSVRHLQRLFREHLGSSPQAQARAARLRLLEWKLRHTRMPLSVLAADCGYADAAHMARSFRAAHGVTPGAWRRQVQDDKNAV
ncbi:GlxA family transcriptional regulator [Castellaniella sp.]|uniref:GlxA family transcriptional regulator n=1 Tax=Castellaniella sp. TaxID=1955812 RepID=UPI00355FEF7C